MFHFGLLLFCVTRLACSIPIEPVCSKFAYEEQMLEKMVRLEFFVDRMHKDVNSSVTDSGIAITTFSEMIEDLEEQFEEYETNISNTMKQNMNNTAETLEDFGKENKKFKTDVLDTINVNSENVNEVLEGFKKDAEDFKTNIQDTMKVNAKNLSESLDGFRKDAEEFETNVLDKMKVNRKNLSEVLEGFDNDAEEFKADVLDTMKVNTKLLSEVLDGFRKDAEEFKADVLDKMKVNTKNVSEALEGFKKDADESKTEILETIQLKAKHLTDELGKLDVSFGKFKTDEIYKMKQQLQSLEEKIKKMKTPLVAFDVYGKKEYSGSGILVFNSVRLNEGNAYSESTGKFTAPVHGLYQFNAHICIKTKVDVEYYIQVGSTKIVTGEYRTPSDSGDGKCTSFSAVAIVRESETVHVGGTLYSNLFEYANDDVCSFSGALIRLI